MRQIIDELDLLKTLKSDIKNSNKDVIKIMCGHFPLNYDLDKKECFEDLSLWGIFSIYTLELGCQIGEYARQLGKDVKLIFIVDDYSYTPKEYWAKMRRDKLYKLRSGDSAIFPKSIEDVLNKYGFSTKDVIRHNHEKKGREDCLYFSENVLRTKNVAVDNLCARELFELLGNKLYVDKNKDYIVTFIPDACSSNVCNYVLDRIENVDGSHIFMFTDELFKNMVDRKSIYNNRGDGLMMGVRYRKS